MPH
ncbi:BgTH12-07756 [Blumeria graminis f. sp. triticale]|jgi:hypothetical protein